MQPRNRLKNIPDANQTLSGTLPSPPGITRFAVLPLSPSVTTSPTCLYQILPTLLPTEPYWVPISSDQPAAMCIPSSMLLHPQGNVAVLQTRPVGSEAWRVATHGSAADTARPWQSLPDPTRRYEQVGQVVKSGVSLNTANWWTRIDPKST